MWLVLTVALVVSSETMRTVLQDVFASASVFVASHLWLLCGLTVVLAALCIFDMTLRHKHPKQPPVVSSPVPVLGPFVPFARNPVRFIRQCYDKYGGVYTIPMMGRRLTVMLGAGNHDAFFNARDQVADQAIVYKFMTAVFGKGIVYDAPYDEFRQQLRFMSGGLTPNALKSYIPKIVKETDEYMAKFGNSGTFDILPKISELIILTASRCLMGDEVREHMFEQVADLYHDMDEGINIISYFMPNAPIPSHFKRDRARKEVVRLFSKVIEARRAKPEVQHDDVLQVFMNARYRDGRQLTNDECSGLLIALLFAGQHTSTIVTSWTLILLLNHPDKLAKVLEEQAAVAAEDPAMNWETVSKMDYLHYCVKEALRMFPPLIIVLRQALADIPVNDYVIPKGDWMVASPSVAHRLPGGFTNPDKFDPERFMRGEDKKADYTFVGFGGGRHACMGERFAMLQVKTIVSTMLRNFDLELVNKTVPEPDYTAMVVPPQGPNLVRFTRKTV